MPRQDRERALERLLPQALADESRASQPGCLDAETLAAWTSGALRTQDAAEVEAHLSDCAHCQAVLGTLVRTAPPAPTNESLWERWHLRWLVPLATAATALTVYLLLPGGELVRAPETTVNVADARRDTPSPTVPAPDLTPSRPAPNPPPAATVGALAAPDRRGASADAAAPAEATRAREEENRVGAIAQEQPAPKIENNQEARALMEKAAAQPSAVTPAQPTAVAAAPLAVPAAPAPVTAPPVAGAAAPLAAEGAFAVRRQVGRDIEIPSPVPTHRYRIVAGQRVERTTTSGKTWEVVTRPVAGEMTAGSAPAIDVCWIVGPIGAVWRTTDGQMLVRIPFPEPLTLVSVRAESASVAIVTSADGRTFRTEDGGKTWR